MNPFSGEDYIFKIPEHFVTQNTGNNLKTISKKIIFRSWAENGFLQQLNAQNTVVRLTLPGGAIRLESQVRWFLMSPYGLISA